MLLKKTIPLEEYMELRREIDFSNVDKIDLIRTQNNYLVEISFKLPLDCSIDELKRNYELKRDYLKSINSLNSKNHTGRY